MTFREFFAAELDREVERSRRALQQMPEGKGEWKPHDKSMKFEYLADMIATIRDPGRYAAWFVPVVSGVVP